MLAGIDEETDAGPRDKGGPERTCIVTRTAQPTDAMIRFVVGPDGAVVPDIKRRLPGRGAWVTARRGILAQAVARNAFARAFKRPVVAGPALVDETERLLERGVLDALAMTYKAGLAVTGFAKVEAALEREPVAALLRASGASADGARKLDGVVRRRFGAERAAPPTIILPGDGLDLAFGRPNVVHAALLAGPASTTFLARHRALEAFRERAPT